MAEDKKEKVHIIPLRDAWKGPCNKRAKKCMYVIREFVKRHMKTDNVKVGPGLNEAVWDKGMKNPPRKVKVQTAMHDEACWVELQGKKLPFEVKAEKEKATKAAEEKKEAAAKKKTEKADAPKAGEAKAEAAPKTAPVKKDAPEAKADAKPKAEAAKKAEAPENKPEAEATKA